MIITSKNIKKPKPFFNPYPDEYALEIKESDQGYTTVLLKDLMERGQSNLVMIWSCPTDLYENTIRFKTE